MVSLHHLTTLDAMSSDWEATWREDMERYTNDKFDIKLLREGPKSWQQACRLQALKVKFKKIMHYE